MAVREILLLGNKKLYAKSRGVHEADLDGLHGVIRDLHDTMMDFRERYGRGRAIAAPQIGVMKRVVCANLAKPIVFINPVLDMKSEQMIELWDDCMSFPELLVRVRRHESCRITYRDEKWGIRRMSLHGDMSELLQHEVDHLDGILAVQRAIDDKSFALAREKQRP